MQKLNIGNGDMDKLSSLGNPVNLEEKKPGEF
jgi:hypothetical protein